MHYTGRVSDVLRDRRTAVDYIDSINAESRGIKVDTEGNRVADIYFSAENLDALQQGIRWRVFVESDGRHVIGRQSDTEIRIVMRSIYLQEGVSADQDVLQQVRTLNAKVLAYCVPRILTEIGMYLKFQRDVSTVPSLLDRGTMVSNKGTRVLNLGKF